MSLTHKNAINNIQYVTVSLCNWRGCGCIPVELLKLKQNLWSSKQARFGRIGRIYMYMLQQ